MQHIHCSGMIFLSHRGVLLEDRRRIKKHGEHWSFFGGALEEGETPEQGLLRELQEELAYVPPHYQFFKTYTFQANSSLRLTYHMFVAPIPPQQEIKVHKKAKAKFFTFKQAQRLRMTAIDKEILRDVEEELRKE